MICEVDEQSDKSLNCPEFLGQDDDLAAIRYGSRPNNSNDTRISFDCVTAVLGQTVQNNLVSDP